MCLANISNLTGNLPPPPPPTLLWKDEKEEMYPLSSRGELRWTNESQLCLLVHKAATFVKQSIMRCTAVVTVGALLFIAEHSDGRSWSRTSRAASVRSLVPKRKESLSLHDRKRSCYSSKGRKWGVGGIREENWRDKDKVLKIWVPKERWDWSSDYFWNLLLHSSVHFMNTDYAPLWSWGFTGYEVRISNFINKMTFF